MEGPKVLRLPDGESITGFRRSFVRRMLWATNQFPQTQAVITPVVAWEVVRAFIEGRGNEVVELLKDLADPNRMPSLIDIEAIARYTSEYYRRIDIPVGHINHPLYIISFHGEIRQAVELVAYAATVYVDAYCEELAMEIQDGSRRTEVFLEGIRRLSLEQLGRVEEFFSVLIPRLTTDSTLKEEATKFFAALRTRPRIHWADAKREYQTAMGNRADAIILAVAGLQNEDEEEV